MKLYISIIMILFMCIHLKAQKNDAVWLFGYDGGPSSSGQEKFGITQLIFLDFGEINVINDQISPIWYYGTSSSICNDEGKLLFSSNGIHIEDSTKQVMQNGDKINDNEYNLVGDPQPQGVLTLPYPSHLDKYFLMHGTFEILEDLNLFSTTSLYYSIVDMTENDGLGRVTDKSNLIIKDTLMFGKLTAVQHANGRDWWILENKVGSNVYYSLLLDPTGIHVQDTFSIGMANEGGLGQAIFSSNGKFFAIYNGVDSDIGGSWMLYSFNRETGLCDKAAIFNIDGLEAGNGIAISPNSRYLYAIGYEKIFQYDLSLPFESIVYSKVLVASYDGFTISDLQFPTRFSFASVAPDGKIYISTPSGTDFLHVINYPNRKGVACDVQQHGLRLKTYNGNMVNYPNFRLGPIDNSPADTLGIDNNPIANFRPDQDTLNHLKIDFTDLSYYEPKTWHWTFGDGGTSDEVNPIHTYPKDGIYEVCLTVSNENSENTACTTLNLGMVANNDIQTQVEINAFPNPMTDYVNLIMNDYYPRDGSISFYDVNGVLLKKAKMRHGVNGFDVSGFPKGVVIYEILDGAELISSGKLICF